MLHEARILMMQEVSKTESVIAGLKDCSMVAHTALATVKGRPYAVVIFCTNSMHWGCCVNGCRIYLAWPMGGL